MLRRNTTNENKSSNSNGGGAVLPALQTLSLVDSYTPTASASARKADNRDVLKSQDAVMAWNTSKSAHSTSDKNGHISVPQIHHSRSRSHDDTTGR